MTDKELIYSYVTNSDNSAFEEFFTKYKDKLYGFICSKTYPEQADDIFQESFKKFISVIFEKKLENPKSYLFMIAMNIMKNRSRNKFKDSVSFQEDINYESKLELPEDIANFETEFDKELDLKRLELALKNLSDNKHEFHNVLHLHIYSGFSFSDIATIEDKKRNTVTGQYLYAIKYLKKYYDEI
ncbi:MAG: sigma-70 family RNA polymerase sigma factor [Candidatus Delongbacteria bacterium]|jgi:RNA polymerase sigma factor (sigma-70 family)|nr:sigma-70 family RNA polymerase sigma factor [Candidatus Delongbacteria bacterium]